MASRRRKTSPAEDLLALVARFPWWVGVALAAVLYVVLHRVALPSPPTALQPGQVAPFLIQGVGSALARVGQYLLPLLCLAGAAVSAWRRRRRECLFNDVSSSPTAAALDDMSWREFEMLVGEAFRLQGFRVAETGRAAADGGVDLVLRKGDENFLIQCKQWKAYKVGVEVVRELYGVMAARGAVGGFVITSGTFTADAKAFAEGRNVRLVDGTRLFALIKQAHSSLGSMPRPASPAGPRASESETAVACPGCGSRMVRRMARRGAAAGNAFWGCPSFPVCKGTRPMA